MTVAAQVRFGRQQSQIRPQNAVRRILMQDDKVTGDNMIVT
ncbi:hypothetical Protein YC6258_04796 [Gynuella sunshinyii YC6258]|uniref:Uncharacterized protein n=1 Tax=Gynuella sunshinyii YC6258 TaxID=1445510 RepID=A0A0C5VU49_9GAMM|nr:hypothetical Protein YC6258_04796 [Gynuella sunshinyii YC6258]